MPRILLIPRVLLPFMIAVFASWASARSSGQTTFATPRQAANALLAAAVADDMPALTRIFGPDADEILNSGDAVEDRNNRTRFVKRARQSMRIDPANANCVRLLI